MLQLMVENDIVPSEHVPEELLALGYPIEATLVPSASTLAAITLRVVLPVQPAPSRDIGPPATSLHLDMAPPPKPRKSGTTTAIVPAAAAAEAPVGPVPERK